MKRVRCPKCDNFITFDETKYEPGQKLIFECPQCGKQFGIRLGVSKLRNTQKEEHPDEQANADPSIDMHHCIINVSYDKHHHLKYVLRDGPSYTGTFVDNEILGDKERRVIEDGSLFTIGATSIILRAAEK